MFSFQAAGIRAVMGSRFGRFMLNAIMQARRQLELAGK
jgi:NAD-dependent oxidoreductase involved in siderophore biosynthesis